MGARGGITQATPELIAHGQGDYTLRVRWNVFPASRPPGQWESCLSQSIGSQFNMIDPGGKSLGCSRADGEGEASAHQSVRDADCSCMLTWQPRSPRAAKWQLRKSLRTRVVIHLMPLCRDSVHLNQSAHRSACVRICLLQRICRWFLILPFIGKHWM